MRALLDLIVFAVCAFAAPFLFAGALKASGGTGLAWAITVMLIIAWAAYTAPRLADRFVTLGSFIGWRPSVWATTALFLSCLFVATLAGAFVRPVAAAY